MFCSRGDFGEVRVHYSTDELDLLEEISQRDEDVFTYFLSPIPGKLTSTGTKWNFGDQPDPLLVRRGNQEMYLVKQCSVLLWFDK